MIFNQFILIILISNIGYSYQINNINQYENGSIFDLILTNKHLIPLHGVYNVNFIPTNFSCSLEKIGSIMQINISSDLTHFQLSELQRAQCAWETVLIGWRSNINPGLVINFSVINIDGIGKILGQAGWTTGKYFTDGNEMFAMATTGTIIMDIADINLLSINDGLFLVFVHEIGHVLGFGTLWTYNKIYENGTGKYFGCQGLHSYWQLYTRTDDNYIPVEQDGNYGTIDAHWDELGYKDLANRPMKNEIMTGFISTESYLTKMTVSSMHDIGFKISPNICIEDSDCLGGICQHGFIDLCNSTQIENNNVNITCQSRINHKKIYLITIILITIGILSLIYGFYLLRIISL